MDDVAGYRVLRSVGHGSRSRLALGHAEGRTVVLKTRAAGDPRVAVELCALDRAAGEHVVRVLDVSADEHGTVLVLERLAGGSLAELLERRSELAAGETVTILAPLAATVERLHAAGVAHGSLSLTSVLFRDDGAPVLVGFGAAELFSPGAPEVVRETIPGVVADRAALRELAKVVLGRTSSGGARRLGVLEDLEPARLAEALHAMADPTAVDLESGPADVHEAHDALGLALEPPEQAADEPRPGVLQPWLVALLPEPWRDRVSEHLDAVRGVWDRWPPRRRRLGVGIAAGALLIVVALTLIPASPSTSAGSPLAGGPTASGPVDPALENAPLGDPQLDDALPGNALPDDPVDAVVLLLARRADCVRELSVLCLDAVVHAGSSAEAEDTALVRSIADGAEYPEDRILDGRPVLVERLGDSALVDLPAGSQPASVLLVKTAEGWRIRGYLEASALETGSR